MIMFAVLVVNKDNPTSDAGCSNLLQSLRLAEKVETVKVPFKSDDECENLLFKSVV